MDDCLNIFIADNGKGFDVSKIGELNINDEDVFGINSIKQRTELLGGSFNIKSEIGRGTIINVKLPIDNLTEKNI
jgi:signal transduction histidine kinase